MQGQTTAVLQSIVLKDIVNECREDGAMALYCRSCHRKDGTITVYVYAPSRLVLVWHAVGWKVRIARVADSHFNVNAVVLHEGAAGL